MKNEVLTLKCHRNLYDQSILLGGARFVEAGVTSFAFLQQIEDRISDTTAAFFYSVEAENLRGSIPFTDIVRLCKSYNVPVIVDAAAELPPVANVRKFIDEGASLVVFSGGKEIRGPQASGMILGTKKLIEACDLNCCPNYGVGRPMKVDKENICGLIKAVELFVRKDYDQQIKTWEEYAKILYEGLKNNKNLELSLQYPTEPGVQPACIRRLYVRPLSMEASQLFHGLIEHDPCIYPFLYQDRIVINPQCMLEHELQMVVDAVNEITE